MTSLKAALVIVVLTLISWHANASDASDQFMRAIKQDNASRIVSLLQEGVDPNTRDGRGVPGVYIAIQEGSLNAARAVIASSKLDPNLLTPTDESLLMIAALKGQLDLARALIQKGAKVNKPGWSPMHYAATGGHVDMIELLLAHHADIEARSPNGTTPLMMAARYGSTKSVNLLLHKGADPRARNELGMDALDFAVSGSRPDAIELMKQARTWQDQNRKTARAIQTSSAPSMSSSQLPVEQAAQITAPTQPEAGQATQTPLSKQRGW